VEGKGEQDAAPRLMKRLWQHLGLQLTGLAFLGH
jgi:hypothetical protein